MKIALIAIDNREPNHTYHETKPRFGTGVDSMIEGIGNMPELELHVISCAQQPMRSPEKLAHNIWFHLLHVPKLGWLRTGYQGCIRAVRRTLREIRPDIVHGEGTERHCGMCAVFSGFPNVIAIAGNMAELARLNRARVGSYYWLTAKFENLVLPRTNGVICNSRYTVDLVRPRAKQTWLIYPGLRGLFLQPPTRTGPRDRALVIAGVVSPRKRQLELLDAAKELQRRGLKFEFRFVGLADSQPYPQSFLQKIKPLQEAGCARYLGTPSHAEMVQIFDAASGMIHFPTEEAFGSVVAEGFARNLKFFGAHTGGIIEIAQGLPGAELFEKEDWTALTDAVAKWIAAGCPSPSGAYEIIKQRYSPEIYVRQHLEVFREVIHAG